MGSEKTCKLIATKFAEEVLYFKCLVGFPDKTKTIPGTEPL